VEQLWVAFGLLSTVTLALAGYVNRVQREVGSLYAQISNLQVQIVREHPTKTDLKNAIDELRDVISELRQAVNEMHHGRPKSWGRGNDSRT